MSAQRERAGNAAKRSTAPGAAVQAGGDPGRSTHQVTCLKGTHPSMCQSVETREKVTELRKRNECRSGKLGYCENRRCLLDRRPLSMTTCSKSYSRCRGVVPLAA